MGDTESTRIAYAHWAGEYIHRFGSIAATHPLDRELVRLWASSTSGRVLDVGCGPGQWTGFLHECGCDVVGVDPVTEFVEHARAHHPHLDVAQGDLESLELPAASIGAVFAWYSLIHLDPAAVRRTLTELGRVIAPGGGVLIGHFAADTVVEPFAHTVITAYRWPVSWLADLLAEAGFDVIETHVREAAGQRPHGAVTARRRDTG